MIDLLSQLPTPLQVIMDPLSLAILAVYLLVILWQEIFPARKLPKVKFWRFRGLLFFTIFFFVASYLPMLTDPYLAKYQLFDLSQVNPVLGFFVGIIVFEAGSYFYHRTVHKFDFLWRSFHQLHHSAERLDAYGALFHSPLDAVGFTIVGSLCLPFILGIPPQSVTAVLFVINFIAFFQHANIKTPHWVGYIIQRPESHSVHHAKGIHNYNFSNLPVFDMVFGTFQNPKNYHEETGFYHGASSRILDMLLFRDISKKKD